MAASDLMTTPPDRMYHSDFGILILPEPMPDDADDCARYAAYLKQFAHTKFTTTRRKLETLRPVPASQWLGEGKC